MLIALCCALALTAGCRQGGNQAAAIDKSITVGSHPRTQTYTCMSAMMGMDLSPG